MTKTNDTPEAGAEALDREGAGAEAASGERHAAAAGVRPSPAASERPAFDAGADRPVLGVFPRAEWEARRSLFDAIERVYPVRIRGFDDTPGENLAGAVHFRSDEVLAWDGRSIPTLSIPASLERLEAPIDGVIDLEFHPQVDDLFHGRSIPERAGLRWCPIESRAGDQVLASTGDVPVWIWRLEEKWNLFISAAPLPDLEQGERLVDRFRPGCFLGLLPLLQLVRGILLRSGWQQNTISAAMLVDGPNLQSERYGRLSLPDLAKNADQYNYHVSIGMRPVDTWRMNAGAVELFRTKRKQLSLHFLGPDEGPSEGRAESQDGTDPAGMTDEDAWCARLALAWKRVERFESKSLVPVSRVVSPESGVAGETQARVMRRLGFEAICYDQPAQWADGDRESWTTVGSLPADLVAGGLPALGTLDAGCDKLELLFRAFWGQPLLVRHKVQDLAGGFESLAQLATFVNSLGEVRWQPVEDLSQANFQRGIRKGALLVRMFGRMARVQVPTVTTGIDVSLPEAQGGWAATRIAVGDDSIDLHPSGAGGLGARATVSPGSQIRLAPCDDEAIDPAAVTTPKRDTLGVLRAIWRQIRERARLFLPFP